MGAAEVADLFLVYYFLPLVWTYLLAKVFIKLLKNLIAGKDYKVWGVLFTSLSMVWVATILLSIYLAIHG